MLPSSYHNAIVYCNCTFNLIRPIFPQLFLCCKEFNILGQVTLCGLDKYFCRIIGVLPPLTSQILFYAAVLQLQRVYIFWASNILCFPRIFELVYGMLAPIILKSQFLDSCFPKITNFYIYFGWLTTVLAIIICISL